MAKEQEIKRRGVTVAKTFTPTKRDMLEKQRSKEQEEKLFAQYKSIEDKIDYLDNRLEFITRKLDEVLSHWS